MEIQRVRARKDKRSRDSLDGRDGREPRSLPWARGSIDREGGESRRESRVFERLLGIHGVRVRGKHPRTVALYT